MAKVRQDAWSHEDDLLLAETVLRHIREGSTQLKAFDEVGG
ncbi:prespore specific transcriptional activator RsfA [Gracilibacillus boraciitolerans JCM 21714]|uniref:Prespore specific transcriptional activator RsfA n=2 Tax=Gracilibacillus TaxID=74385 RepID=W4VMP7_9BACI|nr:prespore specific transcriptional activator RsfA [Gracilibacillus boraciitolerans JCM 21714]